MANEVVLINGVTKKERNGIFTYKFGNTIIDARTDNATIIYYDIDGTQNHKVAFADISDPLGATNVEEYVDALAAGNYYQTVVNGEVTATIDKAGLATEAKQDTGNASLSSIDGKLTDNATETTLAALNAKAATEAKQDAANSLLTQIEANTASSSALPFDAAGRLQTADFETDIDIKHRYDKLSLLVDEVLSGTATSVHNGAISSVVMAVAANNDYAIRQTFERFNYQSGKPKRGMFTFVNIAPQANVIKRVGLYNGGVSAPHNTPDGVYLESDGTTVNAVVAQGGTANKTPQASWTDPLDGTGASGVTVDWTQSQILVIEYLWLGYGPVKFSLEVGEDIVEFLVVNHSNTTAAPYIVSPNQPIRYEIRSLGGAGTFTMTCASVGTSGGNDKLGIERGIEQASEFSNINLPLSGTDYLAYAFRLNSNRLDAAIAILEYTMYTASKDDFVYYLAFNPTISGTPNYVLQANSALEVWTGTGAETITSIGTVLASGPGLQQIPIKSGLENLIRLGHQIDGTQTVIALVIKPLSNGANAFAYCNRVENV